MLTNTMYLHAVTNGSFSTSSVYSEYFGGARYISSNYPDRVYVVAFGDGIACSYVNGSTYCSYLDSSGTLKNVGDYLVSGLYAAVSDKFSSISSSAAYDTFVSLGGATLVAHASENDESPSCEIEIPVDNTKQYYSTGACDVSLLGSFHNNYKIVEIETKTVSTAGCDDVDFCFIRLESCYLCSDFQIAAQAHCGTYNSSLSYFVCQETSSSCAVLSSIDYSCEIPGSNENPDLNNTAPSAAIDPNTGLPANISEIDISKLSLNNDYTTKINGVDVLAPSAVPLAHTVSNITSNLINNINNTTYNRDTVNNNPLPTLSTPASSDLEGLGDIKSQLKDLNNKMSANGVLGDIAENTLKTSSFFSDVSHFFSQFTSGSFSSVTNDFKGELINGSSLIQNKYKDYANSFIPGLGTTPPLPSGLTLDIPLKTWYPAYPGDDISVNISEIMVDITSSVIDRLRIIIQALAAISGIIFVLRAGID